jgi:hypothetical protein
MSTTLAVSVLKVVGGRFDFCHRNQNVAATVAKNQTMVKMTKNRFMGHSVRSASTGEIEAAW